MNGWVMAVTALFTLSTASVISANEVVPAWQEPGFVMEEIVVTASIEQAVVPAWQEPGFVMEEVIVTATAEDVADARQHKLQRHARLQVARLAAENAAD